MIPSSENIAASRFDLRKACNVLLAALAVLLTTVAAGALLYSACCQYSWVRMSLNDYGIYTNFIWNSGHGHFFRYLLDKSYLATHLSFTLLLFGPLFQIWDDAFLLTLVQWLCGIGGLILLWRIMARHQTPLHLRAAIGLCFIGYPYAQSVLLCEFHGVSTYLVLLPWLYYCLAFRKHLVWLPLALILGLREEAGLVAIPLVLYFAATDRWKTGYLYAALALAYCALAVWALFPTLSGTTLGERRSHLLSQERISRSFDVDGLLLRARVLLLLFLPALPFLRRGFLPILLFPSVALVILQVSPVGYHHALQRHYPAAVFTLLILGVVCAVARADGKDPDRRSPSRGTLLALYLIAVTIGTHLAFGYLPYGADTTKFYVRPNVRGWQARMAARHIPREGVLITTAKLTGFTANRGDLITDETVLGRENLVDVGFFAMEFLIAEKGRAWLDRVRSGEFGVTYFDYNYAVFKRGAPGEHNREMLEAVDRIGQTIVFPHTSSRQGKNRYVRGLGLCRFWHGDGSKAPADLSHGTSVRLPPGRYIARFRLASDEARRSVRGHWGLLSVHLPGDGSALAEGEVERVAKKPRAFREQDLHFELAKRSDVEPRVMAGDAALYLDRVVYISDPAPL